MNNKYITHFETLFVWNNKQFTKKFYRNNILMSYEKLNLHFYIDGFLVFLWEKLTCSLVFTENREKWKRFVKEIEKIEGRQRESLWTSRNSWLRKSRSWKTTRIWICRLCSSGQNQTRPTSHSGEPKILIFHFFIPKKNKKSNFTKTIFSLFMFLYRNSTLR